MQVIKFIASLGLTIGVIYLLSTPIGPAPPLGVFLNPFTGFWQNAESMHTFPTSSVQLKALKEEVKVVYDDRLVPHIFAQNDEDLAYAQGYVTAQHRLWQMEFQTHAAAGRISEIVGQAALEFDKNTRRKGLPLGAERALELWKKSPDYALIEAYTAGINTYIQQLKPKHYPLEYKLLGYSPEAWTPLKCALLSKYMANTLARFDNDVETTNALKAFGKATFNLLYPTYPPNQDPIIPANTRWNFKPARLDDIKRKRPINAEGQISHQLLPKPSPHLGSNNWAVAGKKTASGHPILCGDPHLKLSLPSIWFEIQLHTPDMNAYGVSLPGIPNVIIGFNEHIAWSQTNVNRDVLDWYTIEWKDSTRMEYLYDGHYRKVVIRTEPIRIRNAPTYYDTIRYTHHGPIVYENKDHPKQDMALKWLAVEAPTKDDLGVFFKLNKAKNYKEYLEAIANYECPAQNFVFACKDGDIALWTQGRFPLKLKGQGRFVMKGSHSTNDWYGNIPQTHNPHIKNPARGFVSSANQHSTDPSYPYYYNGGFADYRGRYLNRQLKQMDSITAKDMMNLQNDTYGLPAEEALPSLLQFVHTTGFSKKEQQLLEQLATWDYYFDKDKIEPTVFVAWFKAFYEQVWDEIHVYKAKEIPMLYPEMWRTIALLQEDSTSTFFDDKTTNDVETIHDIVTMAFQKAVQDLKKSNLLGTIPNWRDYKRTKINHLANTGTGLDALSVTNVDIGGYDYALNAVSEQNGPSWRMVVELGETVRGYGVYPGGQSGNPGSIHYTDFVDDWANARYFELLFLKSSTEKNDKIKFTQTFKK